MSWCTKVTGCIKVSLILFHMCGSVDELKSLMAAEERTPVMFLRDCEVEGTCCRNCSSDCQVCYRGGGSHCP